jgi:histo-blood group ABO system transferase
MALVRHPGYRRPAGRARLRLYASHPGIAARDAYSEARFGGIGRWETDRASTAFVARRDRSTYVCGATWFGLRASFLAVADELASRTRRDLEEGRIAVWHDESHLNWYASCHEVEILDSSYCYAEGLPGLADLSPRIIAVDKADDRTR